MALTAVSQTGTITITTILREALGINGQQMNLSPTQSLALALAVGSGADQFSKMSVLDGTVTSGAPVSYDFAGSVVDLCTSAAATYTRLTGLVIINYSTSIALAIGGGSNPIARFTNARDVGHGTSVNPGFEIISSPSATGIVVTPATGDILKVDCASSSVPFKIITWGS